VSVDSLSAAAGNTLSALGGEFDDVEAAGGLMSSSAGAGGGGGGVHTGSSSSSDVAHGSGLGSLVMDGATDIGTGIGDGASLCGGTFTRCMYAPMQRALRALLPALHPQIPHFFLGDSHHHQHHHSSSLGATVDSTSAVPLSRAVAVLLSCIACIGLLATVIVLFCESIIAHLGFSSTTMGATLVAFGAEVLLYFKKCVPTPFLFLCLPCHNLLLDSRRG
jgi:Ca2+/Na+ antiporter